MKGKFLVAGAGAVVGFTGLSGVAFAGLNFEPVCVDDSAQITQDTSLEDGVAPLCSDQDEDTLTYAVVTDVAHGTLTFDEVTGEFLYTPDSGFVGTDEFTFIADDGFAVPASADDEATAADVSEEATFSITVAAQVTTTTSTTAAPTTTTTAAVAPTSVLARTGSSNATTAGGGFLAIGLGAGLLAASGALVTRARRTS